MTRGYIHSAALLFLCFVLLSQCTKIDTTSVGSELIPGVDNIHTFDTTLNVIANNFDDINDCDSVNANDLLTVGMINNNPLFGSTLTEGYFDLYPSSFPMSVPAHDASSLVVDSVVLVLRYDHSYGDTNALQRINVFQLTNPLKADSTYRTCEKQTFGTDLLGSAEFTATSLKDSIHAFQEDDANQLRIKLSNALGEALINNASDLTTDTLFKDFFKGFAVVPDELAGGQTISYFNLLSATSRVSIYIRYKSEDVLDTTALSLGFTASSSQANYISRDRNNAEIAQYVDNNPDGDSVLFIQTYPAGSFAQLRIPELSDLPNVVVNRAELIIQQVYDPGAVVFSAPKLLYVDVPDTSGGYIPVPCDFSMNELTTKFQNLGGAAKMADDGAGQQVAKYVFNLTRYTQSIITKGKKNETLRLRAPFYILNLATYIDNCGNVISPFLYPVNALGDGGVKLNGTNATDTRIQFRIIYSKL